MENNFKDFRDTFDALSAIADEENKQNDCVTATATEVMAAYQNANKWLDSIKEAIYIHMNCPFFSSYVHELAHSMPVRFDAYGEILHTINMEIPYPATAEIASKPTNLIDSFAMIFSCLDAIKVALNKFIECTDKEYHGMACAAEACLNNIEGEYPMLYRLQAKAKECGEDTISFDKFVGQYNEHKGDLLESLNEAYKNYATFDENNKEIENFGLDKEKALNSLKQDNRASSVRLYYSAEDNENVPDDMYDIAHKYSDGSIKILESTNYDHKTYRYI